MHINFERGGQRPQIKKDWKQYRVAKQSGSTFVKFEDYGCGEECYQKIVDRYIKYRLGKLLYLRPAVELGDGSVVRLWELYDTHQQGYGDCNYTCIVLQVLQGHPSPSTLETALGYQFDKHFISSF